MKEKEYKEIELNKCFVIEKGNRKKKWKIIEHPFFDNAYAVVRDYSGFDSYLKNGTSKSDVAHIVAGCSSIKNAYETAYDHT